MIFPTERKKAMYLTARSLQSQNRPEDLIYYMRVQMMEMFTFRRKVVTIGNRSVNQVTKPEPPFTTHHSPLTTRDSRLTAFGSAASLLLNTKMVVCMFH